jgi:hypothetical protein
MDVSRHTAASFARWSGNTTSRHTSRSQRRSVTLFRQRFCFSLLFLIDGTIRLKEATPRSTYRAAAYEGRCSQASYSWTRRSLLRCVSGFQHMTRRSIAHYATADAISTMFTPRAHADATVKTACRTVRNMKSHAMYCCGPEAILVNSWPFAPCFVRSFLQDPVSTIA